jgi:hypothetical protein
LKNNFVLHSPLARPLLSPSLFFFYFFVVPFPYSLLCSFADFVVSISHSSSPSSSLDKTVGIVDGYSTEMIN